MKKIFILLVLLILACSDDESKPPCIYEPTLTTEAVKDITESSATLNGAITISSQNCEEPDNTEQGFVYSTETQPDLEDMKVNVNGTTISTTIENLEPNATYYVRTFLINSFGEFYGNEINFTTNAIDPDAPTITNVTAGDGYVEIIFDAPTNDGGFAITEYTATSNPGNISNTISQAEGGTITVSGLTNGTTYTFTVTATNEIGTSEASVASSEVTPVGVPDAPTITNVTAGDGQVDVTFNSPADDGGSTITEYTVTSNPGNISSTISQAEGGTITVTELTNGTAYTFTVTATNGVGTSEASTASNEITPVGVPEAPSITNVTAGDGQVDVTFNAPADDGGFAITEYTATSNPGNISNTISQAEGGTITVTELTNGTTYTFTVTATNEIGTSEASVASSEVTPVGVPDAPSINNVTAGDGQVDVIFDAPTNDGGSAITEYTATSNPGNISSTISQAEGGTITVTELTNGTTYTFTVTAANEIGTSEASDTSNEVIPYTYTEGTVHCDPNNPTEVVDVTNPATGKIWMDRNLGASQAATSSTDAVAYGDLYQWGRGADGHQCREDSQTTATLSSTDQPGHGDFITTSSDSDWRSPPNNNLWQGVDGVNNPCPAGYRLPTEAEWKTEWDSWDGTLDGVTPPSSNNNSSGAIDTPLKLPVAGFRNRSTGSLSYVGGIGTYWSSTVSGTRSFSLVIQSSGAGVVTNSRALGFSVRCIKD